ncbi:hypothetical protein Tco_1322025, partial [Tanacetum coccineum]
MFTCTLAQYVAYKTNVAQQFTPQKHYRLSHPGQAILGPAPAIYASQPTPLPSAFSTMPLQDPTWHMDTGLLDSSYPPSMSDPQTEMTLKTVILISNPNDVALVLELLWVLIPETTFVGVESRAPQITAGQSGCDTQLDVSTLTCALGAH